MEMTGIITDSDMMFYYFQMIQNSGPHTVLDVGMFLKRIGAVSRYAMSTEISEDIILCGIDLFPECQMPIYEEVYNEIIPRDRFFRENTRFSCVDGETFDIAVMLDVERHLDRDEEEALWDYVLQSAGCIMTDTKMGDRLTAEHRIRGYYPVSAGNSSYAWIPLAELK